MRVDDNRIGVEGVFAEIAGVTVSEVCPADVDPTFASQEFDGLAAGLVSQIAGQVKSGDGDAFIHTYLGNLSAQTRDSEGPTVAYVAPVPRLRRSKTRSHRFSTTWAESVGG
jgi:hypothetical protein